MEIPHINTKPNTNPSTETNNASNIKPHTNEPTEDDWSHLVDDKTYQEERALYNTLIKLCPLKEPHHHLKKS